MEDPKNDGKKRKGEDLDEEKAAKIQKYARDEDGNDYEVDLEFKPKKRISGETPQRFATWKNSAPPKRGLIPVPKGSPGCLQGMNFIITGILESLEREDATIIIKKYGGYVVIESHLDTPGLKKLEELKKMPHVVQMTEAELFNLLKKSLQQLPQSPKKEDSPLKKPPGTPQRRKCPHCQKIVPSPKDLANHLPGCKEKEGKPKDNQQQAPPPDPKDQGKPPCKYGKDCYRRNPSHFADFAHPHLTK